MSKSNQLTAEAVLSYAKLHRWAATGVSDYPPCDPLVGQSRFFKRYRTFIHTVDQDDDNFAHVFAVEAEWGRGKSRLGHELIAQINDNSKGWFIRDEQGQLVNQKLFSQAEQDYYLALYIRYSQVASDYQNSDNWFGFGLYKALIPMATGSFDASIQSVIAKQALDRLRPAGFESEQLAKALEIHDNHSDEDLYEQDGLVVRLVQAAYAYLQKFGIKYVLVVLDELETVAEAATFGIEHDDTKRLDGQAIRLIGKAIKEEDPRRKLPWLRYVALCSPLLGQQLREIQSVARRFELVELEHNAFADVSDYVNRLQAERKLSFDYPSGLVEAAYAMSGGNFGWFNVIMANIDAVLTDYRNAGKQIPMLGELFDAVIESSGRVAKYVLDRNAIDSIKTGDHELKSIARTILYGQLPHPLYQCHIRSKELLKTFNEDGEPVTSLYRKIPYDPLQCRQALEEAKFRRELEDWTYPAIEQPLSLNVMLQNMKTFAINEPDSNVLLLPLERGEFKHLLSLLYDHPAIEYAADALWQKLIGNEQKIPDEEATHIGPSVAMLLRLDLRYRNRQNSTMIFRDAAETAAHETVMKNFLQTGMQKASLRFQIRLTGLIRLLDKNWQYNQLPYPNKVDLTILTSQKALGTGQKGGLLFCEPMKLHPDNLAWFSWVNNRDELEKMHNLATIRFTDDGRFPTVAFTASTHLVEQYNRGDVSEKLKDDLLLYYLNPSEVDQIERIGLPLEQCKGFTIDEPRFTSKFKNKLNTIRDFTYQAMNKWRDRLNQRGLIAWPLRPTGKINHQDRELLFRIWKLFAIDDPELNGLNDLDSTHGIDAEEAAALMQRLAMPSRYLTLGYSKTEHAGLFNDLDKPQQAQPNVPHFLSNIANPSKTQEWKLDKAKRDWYWGYLSYAGLSPKHVFEDWMWWCSEINLLQLKDSSSTNATWVNFPRAKLDNSITEAENWFLGTGANSYTATVGTLEQVFGYDRIPGLFAPVGKSPVGTETVEAHDQLKTARKAFDQLKIEEEALINTDDLRVISSKLPALLKSRSQVLVCVNKVKPAVTPIVTLGNMNTLRLDDKSQSLYQRIEQARLFAEYVNRNSQLIKNQIEHNIFEMDADCEGLTTFPKSLFTLSLQTVSNILDGALQQQNSSSTASTESTGSSETFLHYLRSLQLDKAAERMNLLADEAGVTIETGTTSRLSDNSGHILSTYRAAKKRYTEVVAYLQELQERCQNTARYLDPLPSDYKEATHPQVIAKAIQSLVYINDAFEDLAEQAGNEREKFRELARKGQFSLIRDVPDRLFNPINSQLHPIGAEISKVENTIQSYREKQIAIINDEYIAVLRPLFLSCNKPAPQDLMQKSFAATSLHNMQIELDALLLQWEKEVSVLLEGTGLDLPAWKTLARKIADGSNPELPPHTQQELVKRGILKMKLSFGVE